jgi:hypothetical protein
MRLDGVSWLKANSAQRCSSEGVLTHLACGRKEEFDAAILGLHHHTEAELRLVVADPALSRKRLIHCLRKKGRDGRSPSRLCKQDSAKMVKFPAWRSIWRFEAGNLGNKQATRWHEQSVSGPLQSSESQAISVVFAA